MLSMRRLRPSLSDGRDWLARRIEYNGNLYQVPILYKTLYASRQIFWRSGVFVPRRHAGTKFPGPETKSIFPVIIIYANQELKSFKNHLRLLEYEPHPLSPSPYKARGNAICGIFPFTFPSPFRRGDRGEVLSEWYWKNWKNPPCLILCVIYAITRNDRQGGFFYILFKLFKF